MAERTIADGMRFVGRERERAALGAALANAHSGRGSVVLIGGEAGIGKTALAEVLLAEAASRGSLVLVGRCYDLGETPPYGPWVEALVRAPGGDGLPPLPTAMLQSDREGATLVGQDAIFGRVRDYLTALAARGPLLLLLEDLHWADPTSLELLRVSARGLADAPILLLATYRTDEVAGEHPLAAFLPALVRESRPQRLELHPLSRAAIGALVAARYTLGGGDHDRLVGYLERRTEGNALFLSELLRALESAGTIRGEGGRWLVGDLERVPVPPLLRQVIEGRVARLAPETRRLLPVAAVIGQEVPLPLWALLGEMSEEHLLDHAEPAFAARLLEEIPDGSGVRFAHALIREALYAGTPALRRRLLHRRAADALLATPVPDPDAVAAHLGRAGDPRELDWLVRAGERALARHAPQPALDRLTRALALASRRGVEPGTALYRARGLARETLGDFAGALGDHEAALMAARAAGDRRAEWRAQLDLGQLWASRDYARAGEYYARALALARALDDPVALADSLNRLGNWQVNTGHPAEGVVLHREALALLEALRDPRALADTLDMLGMAEWIGTGEAAESVRDFGRAIDLLRAQDRPRQLSSCLASRSGAAGAGSFEPVGTALWDPAACLRDAAEAERLAEMADWAAGRAYPAFLAGQILANSGDFGPALARLEGALALATAIDHHQWLAGTRCNLGQLHHHLLDADAARRHLEQALALALDLGSTWWIAYAASYLALAHVRADDTAAAERVLVAVASPLVRAAAVARTIEERRLAWAWSELRLAQGRYGEALAIADDLLATAPGTGPIPALLLVRGAALLALGRADEASLALDDAARGALLRHERPLLWRAHASRAMLLAGQGRVTEAAHAAAAARKVIAQLAATLPRGALRDGFLRRATALLPAGGSTVVTAAPAPSGGRGQPATLTHGLSRREAEVLRLLARGRNNHQIAAAFSLSPRTVQRHIANLYLKIGVHNKAEATVYAIEHGLR